MHIQSTHYTDTIEIKLREDGILEISVRPELKKIISEEEMSQNIIRLYELNLDHSLFLVTITHGKYSREARKLLSSQEDIADKIAMVAKTPYQKIVGNFFLGLYRPKIKIKLFTSKEQAEKWLLRL